MLTLCDITWKAGRNGPALLRDVRLLAHPGELVAVIGPNGAGKSTLLKLIAGDHPVQQGSVQWCGQDLQRMRPQAIARDRAVLDQRNAVGFGFSVREVVMMGRYPHFSGRPSAEDRAAVDRAMRRLHVDAFSERDISTLSGGEQQRVHIARTWAQLDTRRAAPRLLLLDEPLNDLDVPHQHALLADTRRFAEEGHVVLAVLHDVNLAAQYAHRIVLLSKGRVLAEGPPNEVLTRRTLLAGYGLDAHVTAHPFLPVPLVHFTPAALVDRSTSVFQPPIPA